nr:metallophosphoesterase [uncultured Rhodoferax sp.]
MPGRRIRIVHISDLHLGKDATHAWRVRRVLGEAWRNNLTTIASDGPIDLVCFTGDVAQSGQAGQYEEATAFVHEALHLLNVPMHRFFCIPGNHDVDRSLHKNEWAQLREGVKDVGAPGVTDWLAGGQPPRGFEAQWLDNTLARQAAYQQWLVKLGRQDLLPKASPHGRLGYRASIDLGLEAPLHLIGLDSAWLAGDDHDASKLILTDGQIGRLCTQQDGRHLGGWCVAMLHHPIGDLADGRSGRRLLAEHGVSLLLHGHLHDPELARWDTPSQGLHVSAAGCLYEHDRFPNSLQVLDIELSKLKPVLPVQLWSRTWSARGHWHNDDACYPNSANGRLPLIPDTIPPLPLAIDEFVGRKDQLTALKRALLPPVGQEVQPALVCCAIEGMPGVGKTRLAEEFVTRHWLPHWGLEVQAGMAEHVVRLSLSATEPAPSTEQLGQMLADRLRLPGYKDSLWPRVGAALRHGPAGKPCLLWVDNVDTQALAKAVAPLGHHLKGCALLVTARFQRLGGNGWQRVPVQPLNEADGLKLLLSQLDNQGASIHPADARDLVRHLGGLPLALHIAASHLNLGHTPRSFLAELRDQGLGLPPADGADPALFTDYARAVIRHSFDLSWQHWCAHQPAEWQQALPALAHGPVAELGPELAASLAGLTDEAWERMAPQAIRLSLLQTDPLIRRASLHPLIAEFLRGQASVDAALVCHRLSAWFMPQLPETGDERQGQAWGQVWAEPAALEFWLSLLPLQEGLQVERTAKDLAVIQGPFGIWRNFLEGLLSQTTASQHISNLYWTLTQLARHAGDMEVALSYAQQKFKVDQASGDEREQVLARGAQADILQARGQLDEALRIRQEEQLPVYERLGDVHSKAVTMGKIADILQARGQLNEALRIRQEEELPVYERLGDVRSKAVTMGKIADILQDRGQLDEALRIRQEEEVPVYERLGDVREKAVTMGKIADILQARGQLDEALRILSEEVRPAFERLGDVRSLFVCRTNLAQIYAERGHEEDRPKIETLLRDAHAAARNMQLPEALQIAEIYQHIFGRALDFE